MEKVQMTTYQITKRDYAVWLEVTTTVDGLTSYSFQTQWGKAANPNELHNKFQMLLTADETERLIQVLQQSLEKQQ